MGRWRKGSKAVGWHHCSPAMASEIVEAFDSARRDVGSKNAKKGGAEVLEVRSLLDSSRYATTDFTCDPRNIMET